MRHESHGYTHAYNNVEELQLKANGWVEAVKEQKTNKREDIKKRGRPAKVKG